MRWLLPVVLALVLFAAPGCKDDNPISDDSPSTVIFPANNVSFGRHVLPLFTQACALSGCHDDGQHESALKLTSYGAVVYDLPGIVVRNEPDKSTLVFRIEGRVGARMPPGNRPLNQNQINGIRTWIAEGALNN